MARMVSPAALPSARARRPDRSRPPPPRPSFEPAPPRDRAAHAPGVGESPARARGDAAQRRARRAPDAALRSRARALGRAARPRDDRERPRSRHRAPGDQPLRRAPRADAGDTGRARRARGRPPGCRRALLHVSVDAGPRHARLRAGGRRGRRARPAQPARPGLTLGELARWLALEHGLGGRLSVVEMRGWRRAMLWEDTGVPWVAPSPNMPTPDTARVYPGGCLIEGTNLSEGRGTTRPFEWVGAPYLDAHDYTAALDALRLPGVAFRPARFTPTFHKWAGRLCGGVQIHVTDRATFKPFLTGLAVISAARRLRPRRFAWKRPPYEFERRRLPIDILLGTDRIRRALERGRPLREIERSWTADLARWRRRRERVLAYR